MDDEKVAWQLLITTSVTVLAVFLNATSINVGLPQIASDLGADAQQSSWLLLSYMLTTTALILAFGGMGDRMGRRWLYILGVLVFCLGSIACACAGSVEQLIAFRFVQGIGAAAVITNNTPILTDVFPHHLLSTGLGVNATVAALGQVLGPLYGGLTVDLLGWRWMFLLLVPLALVGAVAAAWAIPPDRPTTGQEPLDVRGSVLVVALIAATVFLFNGVPGLADDSTATAVLLGVLCLLAVLAVLHQKYASNPLVDKRLLTERSPRFLYLAGFLAAFSNYATVLLCSLFLQSSQGFTALQAGLYMIPSPLGTAIAAVVAGRLVRRHRAGRLSAVGLALIGSGNVLIGFGLVADGGYAAMGPGLLVVGVGIGLFMTPNTTQLMTTVPENRRGIGNALRSTFQNGGYMATTSVSLALATVLLDESDAEAAFRGVLAASGGDVEGFTLGVVAALAALVVAALAAIPLSLRADGSAR